MEGGFDALRAVVVGGSGVVARFPGVVCVVAAGGAEPVRALLDLCAKAAGTAPGRPLGRSLARWLAGPDAPPDDLVFGTVAAADDRVAVFLSGDVDARVAGVTLSGAESAAWTDRLVTQDGGPLVLATAGAAVPADVGEHVHDLRSGVVPGGAVALLPAGAGPSTGAHAVPEVAEPAPAPAVEVEPRAAAPPAVGAHRRPRRRRRAPAAAGRGRPAGGVGPCGGAGRRTGRCRGPHRAVPRPAGARRTSARAGTSTTRARTSACSAGSG